MASSLLDGPFIGTAVASDRSLRGLLLRLVSGRIGNLEDATHRERAKFEMLQLARAEGMERAGPVGRSPEEASAVQEHV